MPRFETFPSCTGKLDWQAIRAQEPMTRLRVHSNHHLLADDQDRPLFWLGDTAWEMIQRLNREQVIRYWDATGCF